MPVGCRDHPAHEGDEQEKNFNGLDKKTVLVPSPLQVRLF